MRRPLLLVILDIVALVNYAASQSCYYPNGELSNDFPCSSNSGGVMCCPFQWECLDNGLCYNPAVGIMGRYTCTDQSWESKGCPGFCTSSDSSMGDEAVLSCSNGQYCCDRNRQVGDCCDWPSSNQTFFNLDAGNVFATVITSGTAEPTSEPGPSLPGLSLPGATITTSQTSTNQRPTSSSDSGSAFTTTTTVFSAASGSDGPSTVTVTTIFIYTPSPSSGPASTPSSSTNSSNHVSVIAGCAIGIPLGIGLAGAVLFILCRRRRDDSSSISSRSTSDQRLTRRFSGLPQLWKKAPEPFSESILVRDISDEKIGEPMFPAGTFGAVPAEGRERPRAPNDWDKHPLRVHVPRNDPDRISLVDDMQMPTVCSPTGCAPNPRYSWNSTPAMSPYSPLQGPLSPSSIRRLSGGSDDGFGGWIAPSAPHLDMHGPGGLSPVLEEPGYNLDAPPAAAVRSPEVTPGGRYIPYRTPSVSMHRSR